MVVVASLKLALGAAFVLLAESSTKDGCECLYQGKDLPLDLYTNYPSNDPGKYKNLKNIKAYGIVCGAWDFVPNTPYFGSCTPGSRSFSTKENNWCQIPWCYVSQACETKIPTSVFNGSSTAYYSYDTCGGAPNCYSDWDGEGSRCPYDPSGTKSYAVHKADCACKYAGLEIPDDLLENFPKEEPGKYKNLAHAKVYGTNCASWDQVPSTPWFEEWCPEGSDWCHSDYNWCQLPWCYVNEDCLNKDATDVFNGSTTAFYSYDTCLKSPDCYNAHEQVSCPFDASDNGWSTAKDCPSGWTIDGTSASVRSAVLAGLPGLLFFASVA
eukprot:TRINITY_DN22964_c0_g1_i1.p1 TRINITY_DN22964_c0_g1~~TRINITY_DN22964_c0_g1_i1.p1  ORF type:complete len:345 (+),score=46.96 TRINITY_DN22964_c0_g1_i1:62-1036(+)